MSEESGTKWIIRDTKHVSMEDIWTFYQVDGLYSEGGSITGKVKFKDIDNSLWFHMGIFVCNKH